MLQEAVIGELRAKGMVADKRLLSQEDVYHGALEDILIGGYFSHVSLFIFFLKIKSLTKKKKKTFPIGVQPNWSASNTWSPST